MVPTELRLIAFALLGVLLVWVVRLIRQQRLSVQDSLAWLGTSIAALAVVAFPQLLVEAARLAGIQVPSNALFLAGLLYLGVNVLTLTIAVSENAARVRRLTQECSMLRAEIEALSTAPRNCEQQPGTGSQQSLQE